MKQNIIELSTVIGTIIAVFGAIYKIFQWFSKQKIQRNNYKKRVDEILTRINNLPFIKNKFEIIAFRSYSKRDGIIKVSPIPKTLDKQIEDTGKQIAEERKEYPNDNIAVVEYNRNSIAKEGDITISYMPMKYSEYLAMKMFDPNLKNYILSVNGFVFCEKIKAFILHKRNQGSIEYTNLIHSFGGAYQPEVGRIIGDRNVIDTLEREIREEAGFKHINENKSHIILTDEHSIKFLQVGFLGIRIDKNELEYGQTNWEGTFEKISFNKIEDRLCNKDIWAPSGWAKIMVWLGLNCPNLKRKRVFNNKTGDEVYESVLKTFEKVYS